MQSGATFAIASFINEVTLKLFPYAKSQSVAHQEQAPREGVFVLRDEQVVMMLRHALPESYFINTPVAHMRHHLELLTRLQQGNLALDFHRHKGAKLTELTLCTFDQSRPGLMAKVCGALCAQGIDIRTASIYTLRPQEIHSSTTHPSGTDGSPALAPLYQEPPLRMVALDIMQLSEPYFGRERALSSSAIQRAQDEIERVLQTESINALWPVFRRRIAPVSLQELQIENRDYGAPFGRCTAIVMRAEDTPGLLFRTTAALAELNLNILVAQVNSHDGMAEDTFFVTDAQGEPLPEDELPTIARRLTQILQSANLPWILDSTK
jgi:UTP:GlnB (protein PII) uridylyltransferase